MNKWLKRSARRDKTKWTEDILYGKSSAAHHNTRELCQIIKRLSNRSQMNGYLIRFRIDHALIL